MKLVLAALLAACLVGTLGCNQGRRRGGGGGGGGGTDSGTPGTDSGTPGTDSGIPGTDSGIPGTDSGTPTRDSGPTPECTIDDHCGALEMCSSGTCVARSCPTDTVSRVTTQYCDDATQTCLEGCADSDCIWSCLEADPSPDCSVCAQQNIISCLNRNGCQEEWNCLDQCADDNCPAGSASTCLDTYCSAESDAYDACAATVPESASCGSEWLVCAGF